MVSLKSYRIQLSSACNYKSKMNFQKTALCVSQNALYLVQAMIGGRGFRGLVLITIAKMLILAIFLQLQELLYNIPF